ncbi:outer membrane protein [Rhodoplanes sp. Z2-YC6860]|uniref:outer membrane protein n=1 Tax=Rhodoplanes sp. Z2-YC6860 TaxID=674703 RepID=UPI00078B9D1E|nr:outer membrane beta-barrel protein [Rhodoplanes sp. Z2-YC6860]AMN41370.1 porin [Rhodoplanes sp. Z2-YC6860]
MTWGWLRADGAAFGIASLRPALIAAASVVALAQTAQAAPPSPPALNWTGFYAGGNLGYGFGDTRAVIANDSPDSARLAPAGIIGGGQLGYRFQQRWLVIGAEADLQWSGQDSLLCGYATSRGCSGPITNYRSTSLDWFGTVRGTLGFAQGNSLLYATGGFAYGRIQNQASGIDLGGSQFASGDAATTRTGWTIGAGVETRLPASNWSVKLEYLYLDFGHSSYAPQCAGAPPGAIFDCSFIFRPAPNIETSDRDHVVRIGLNYNFGGAQPAAMPAPLRAAPMPAVDWSGFYIGGNVGYGVGHDRLELTRLKPNPAAPTSVTSLPQSPNGITGGGQAGYRFQRGWFVIGAEADFQWSGQRDASCLSCVFFVQYDEKREWFGTVRGVAGVAQGISLWYLTGGYAYGRFAIDKTTPASDPINASITAQKGGWTAGAGVETRLGASNWSARLEYLYMDLGDVTFFGTCTAAVGISFNLRTGQCERLNNSMSDHIVRIGLNYTFGQPPR